MNNKALKKFEAKRDRDPDLQGHLLHNRLAKRQRTKDAKTLPRAIAFALATEQRRRVMPKKQRKAEDFFLGRRPPRPWYYPGQGKRSIFPKWDETKRRAIGLQLAQALGAQLIVRPHQKRSLLGRLKGFFDGAFKQMRTA